VTWAFPGWCVKYTITGQLDIMCIIGGGDSRGQQGNGQAGGSAGGSNPFSQA